MLHGASLSRSRPLLQHQCGRGLARRAGRRLFAERGTAQRAERPFRGSRSSCERTRVGLGAFSASVLTYRVGRWQTRADGSSQLRTRKILDQHVPWRVPRCQCVSSRMGGRAAQSACSAGAEKAPWLFVRVDESPRSLTCLRSISATPLQLRYSPFRL